MNRRGFLRGAISVMAVAAILKGRMPKEGLTHITGNLTTYFENEADYLHFRGTPKPMLADGGHVNFLATPEGGNIYLDAYNWERR